MDCRSLLYPPHVSPFTIVKCAPHPRGPMAGAGPSPRVQRSPWEPTGLSVLRGEDFSGVRLNRSGTFVVCFGAAWCPITRRFMPKFVAERERIRGTLAIADITDTNDPLWDTFRIRITPSILAFQDGEVRIRVDGRRFIGVTAAAMRRLEESLRSEQSK